MPDFRRPGHNERCNIAAFVKSAFGVVFFQRQSMLDYQRRMKEQHGRNNLETVFGGSRRCRTVGQALKVRVGQALA
ncbi:MAG: hypothetical protein LBF87_01585 [Treponema sp.]|jgi:hypothetical protein|nr:hypothetical protein [Treponema sp.]